MFDAILITGLLIVNHLIFNLMNNSNKLVDSDNNELNYWNRRGFLQSLGLGSAAIALLTTSCAEKPKSDTGEVIQGFEKETKQGGSKIWTPVTDRKVKVGLIGYGVCKFAAAFGFQDHPNVEVVAVSDLMPERCAELAKVTNCKKTYPSLEELLKDDSIEAVFIATDAASHAKHTIMAVQHGKHVACAVPAALGSLEEADEVFEAVKKSGLKYMMFETSMYHADLYAARQLYNSGHLGKLVYSEGEYYHYASTPIDSFKGWRVGLPPQFYPTHSNAYHLGVNDGSFIEVSCMGLPSKLEQFRPGNNPYKNSFATEIALFRTHDGGMSRMAVSWDTPGDHGERGRVRGEKGSYYGKYEGLDNNLPDLERPALPPSVDPGGHGGSHGRLTEEFITAILQDRSPLVNVALALNMTVAGIVPHHSALKNGELLKIPQYKI